MTLFGLPTSDFSQSARAMAIYCFANSKIPSGKFSRVTAAGIITASTYSSPGSKRQMIVEHLAFLHVQLTFNPCINFLSVALCFKLVGKCTGHIFICQSRMFCCGPIVIIGWRLKFMMMV